MRFYMGAKILDLQTGDITHSSAQAIVNAANHWLADGGGVTGAIFRSAGQKFAEDSEKIGYCPPGHAVIVSLDDKQKDNDLLCDHVIHAVGIPYNPRRVATTGAIYREMYGQCFSIAQARSLRSIAFPLCGTGVYGVPVVQALKWFYQSLVTTEWTGETSLVLYDVVDWHVARSVLLSYLEEI